jgi:hypothetical protein
MRGLDERTGSLFSYVDLEDRSLHPATLDPAKSWGSGHQTSSGRPLLWPGHRYFCPANRQATFQNHGRLCRELGHKITITRSAYTSCDAGRLRNF